MRARCELLLTVALGLACGCASVPSKEPEPAPPAGQSGEAAEAEPQAAPLIDRLSPLLASGTRIAPEDLEWSEPMRALAAGDLFENLQLLGEVNSVRLMQGMGAMPMALGVECAHCHDEEDHALDVREPKHTARRMLEMAHAINHDYFEDRVQVACWSCHRGSTEPEHNPPPEALMARRADFPASLEPPAGREGEPAETVYKNIRVLKGLPAGRIKLVMAAYAAVLGVGCEHCHVETAFDSDAKPAKRRAREMAAMRAALSEDYFANEVQITCWTCHRGQLKPELRPGG